MPPTWGSALALSGWPEQAPAGPCPLGSAGYKRATLNTALHTFTEETFNYKCSRRRRGGQLSHSSTGCGARVRAVGHHTA